MTSTPNRAATDGIVLDSGLWLDQPDAKARIDARHAAGTIDAGQAERLRDFVDHGYMVLDLDVEPELLDAVVDGVDRLWRERPADLAYACDSPARPMRRADPATERRKRYRIHDLHSHVPAARALYLHPQIHREIQAILGEHAVAIQSLFFEYGSEQMLHRDPVVVPTGAPGHLLAAWIALEDISPECGALVYVPGSHTLPYYAFGPGQYMYDASTMGDAEAQAAFAFDEAQCQRHGLEPKLFTAKKGQALIWHASLRHGGSPVRDPDLTRKSLVVHFSAADTYRERGITVFDAVETEGGVEERPRIMMTDRVLREDGCAGYDNPMLGSPR